MSFQQSEHRFKAAVNVIRGLPKNGSYQPSNDMMLRFYSYFKQATLGPCTQKRPAFWDVVNKAKWDAYKSLGSMPKQQAMELYVEELKKIIETMSYTDNVAEFMGSISELNGIDVQDLETIAPEIIKKAKSHPNSPFASRDTSPIRSSHQNGHIPNGSTAYDYSMTNGFSHHSQDSLNGHTSDHSDDEFIDTVEDDTILTDPIIINRFSRTTTRRSNGHLEMVNNVEEPDSNSLSNVNLAPAINQLCRTIDSMRLDLQQINSRIDTLERSLLDVKNHQLRKQIMTLKYPKWWPFTEISPSWFIFMIMWPFLAQRMVHMLKQKRQ